MKKHVPVLLNEVILELEKLDLNNEVYAIDCTLGQAGHSWEIYSRMKKGVLLSIDLNESSIEWVAGEFGLEMVNGVYSRKDGEKEWRIVKGNFGDAAKIFAEQEFPSIKNPDFILADLGFSNFELTQNLGVSYSDLNQDLNMNYSGSGLTANSILNTYSSYELESIFKKYFDSNSLKVLVQKILSYRLKREFKKVIDLKNALKNLPDTFFTKAFQALRSKVNDEDEKLINLAKTMLDLISEKGSALIITFNPTEEQTVNEIFNSHQTIEPNINEIIKNPQSRSAKLHIYKKERHNLPNKKE